jgi:hypothetical protein
MKSPMALAPLLLPGLSLSAAEAFKFDTSYQTYDESGGRMFIESYYYRGEMFLSEETSLRFQLLRDAITGSTPIGALPGGTQDERLALLNEDAQAYYIQHAVANRLPPLRLGNSDFPDLIGPVVQVSNVRKRRDSTADQSDVNKHI